MLKKLMIGTALGAIALSGAMAQSSPPASSQSAPPAMKSDSQPTPPASSSSSSSMSSPSASSSTTGQASSSPSPSPATTASMPASADKKFVSSQSSEQFLASKFTGTDVVGTDDKKIGDVNDVLFDKQGKIMAYVVGVGGFLGIGSKNVALEPSSFTVVKGENNSADKLKLAMTKEELEKAPNFEPYKDPSRTTTGSGGPGIPRAAFLCDSRPRRCA